MTTRAYYSPMDPARFRMALRKLGFSEIDAANFLGFNERSIRRMADGQQLIPKIVALVLDAMIYHQLTPQQMLDAHRWFNEQFAALKTLPKLRG